jgi:hypothetical protein
MKVDMKVRYVTPKQIGQTWIASVAVRTRRIDLANVIFERLVRTEAGPSRSLLVVTQNDGPVTLKLSSMGESRRIAPTRVPFRKQRSDMPGSVPEN